MEAVPLLPASGIPSSLKLIMGDLPKLDSEETMLDKLVRSTVPPIKLAGKVVSVTEG